MTPQHAPAPAPAQLDPPAAVTPSFVVRRIPDTAPRVISADEAWATGSSCCAAHAAGERGTEVYAQGALALDFSRECDEDDFGPQPTRSSLLPQPEPFVATLAQAVMEVLSGQRPASQLARHLSPTVHTMVARRALVATRRAAPGARRAAMVRRVRVCEPADGVVEACAVVVSHGRVGALALRLEGRDGRWVATALTVG
ncbi:Rv3235 family protein [Terracoccus luteus]|jgi:hypothetical protein|uniref:3-hydroxyacyl-CoA dehydrogenase n=1 Tax=Terracoccus luteus TaxID=53356 RepID=A0A839PNB5_9MICO|nr:Rv3235 family protein [Terracoccus luteus]MBB2985778.1 hypothetical protein [Terracoccus luteus]MCP2171430.1 hypothetical protein [Terracoccus luteus]